MPGSLPLDAALALLSGLALLAVGLRLMAPPCPRDKQVLGGFLIAWGLQVTVANLSRFTYEAGALGATRTLLLASTALLFLAAGLALTLAGLLPGGTRDGPVRPASGGSVLFVATLGALLVLVAPWLFHGGFVERAGQVYSRTGPLQPVAVVLFMGALYHLLRRLDVMHRTSRSALERRRAGFLLVGLLLFTSYWVAAQVILYGWWTLVDPSVAGLPGVIYLATAGAGVIVLARLATGHRGASAVAWRERRLFRGALGWPALAGGTASFGVVVPWLPYVETLGLWRLATAAAIGYAVLRFEVPNLEARARTALVAAGVGVAALVLAMGVGQVLGG